MGRRGSRYRRRRGGSGFGMVVLLIVLIVAAGETVRWMVAPTLILFAALWFGWQLYRGWQYAQAGMDQIDRMSGTEFEQFLEVLFQKLGYNARRIGGFGDQGGDLILTRDGQTTLVQAKRWQRSVSNKAIQEAAAARPYYRCDRAMVVTNSTFTEAACELAASNAIELWDRRRLARAVRESRAEEDTPKMQPRDTRHETRVSAPTLPGVEAGETGLCPRCRRAMVLRSGKRGQFWGCSGFPRCRYTAEVVSTSTS